MVKRAVFDEHRYDLGDDIGRDYKPNTGIGAHGRLDGGRNADDASLAIHQDAARVARIDGRVGLNDVRDAVLGGKGVLAADGEQASQGAHEADGHRVLQTERIANGNGNLSDLDLGGVRKLHRLQLLGIDIDLEHGQIAIGICAHHFGLCLRAVGEDDADLVGVLNHVVVGHNVALLVPDETGTGAVAVELLRCIRRLRVGRAEGVGQSGKTGQAR